MMSSVPSHTPSLIELEVTDLRKRLGKTDALRGLNLRFDAGLMHGVIGPEGAGKTTLFRHLVGLLRADAGTVAYREDGRALAFDDVRARIAYMPQQQSLYPDLSIGEHLDFFRSLYRLDDAEFARKRERLLEITRLGKFVDRPAGKLSGGMYKKLGLMCALLASPSVLLLDEPTNGVDPISRREFWELLYELSGQGMLILVATAYMDEAERCARVHLVNAGRSLASGEPKQLLEEAGVSSFDEYFLRRSRENGG
ncbi:MAG: ABC transporter ATP-binding protein [Bacteriovoracia bacterium]